MNSSIDVSELLRYLAGESPADEAVRVQAWSHRSLANAALLKALRMGGSDDRSKLSVDVARGMQRLRGRLDNVLETDGRDSMTRSDVLGHSVRDVTRSGVGIGRWEGSQTRPLRRWMWPTLITLAVGLLAIVWTSGVGYSRIGTRTSMMVYTTGNGERATITLPDSGTVALNVASRLEVPMDYSAGHHAVRLSGEGLFTVSHHDGAPLTVTAGNTTVRVLGTSFVVRHYETDTRTLVAVRDGKVAVGNSVVARARLVAVGRDGVPRVSVSDGSLFTFSAGVLTLDGLPLRSVIPDLDRWYDADVRLGDSSLATRHATGSVAAGSLSDLAEMLEWTYDVRVVRDGRVLTLIPRR